MNCDIMISRTLSIVAHIDSGKSSLTDTFVTRAGLMSSDEAGTKRWTDNREDEKERGITIKSTGVSMNFDFEGQKCHINLIDTPGHVDFSSEVSAAIRITDGAIVVLDAVNGVEAQTETVLRQALAEQVKPILFINKMDRYIFELQLTPEEAYNKLVSMIAHMNELVSMYQSEDSALKLDLSPELGTVIFGSARDGWGFGLHTFARMMTKNKGGDEQSFMKKLWGDNYLDPESKKITTKTMSGNQKFERTFCKFILDPIFKLAKALKEEDIETYQPMLKSIGVTLTEKESKLPGKELYKVAMRKFLPLGDLLLHSVINHLPSPIQAQAYRYNTLYDGPLDDECALAIKNCDPNGPLMIYISKQFPMDEGGRFYAFGRVFSGTVKTGQKVRIMGNNYKYGLKDDLFENKAIQRICKMVGNKTETCDFVECGNTVALVGVDQFILKSCTITTHPTAYPIKTMKFSVSPVVRVSVAPKNPSDLPKLVEGLIKLSKSDPCVQVITKDGENIVAGVGELHIEICMNDLRAFMKCDLKVGDPIVPLRETVLAKSSQVCLAKSPNKHNRIFSTAEPINDELVAKMHNKEITGKDDVNARSKILVNDFNWDPNDAKKLWFCGPEGDEETNLVVDMTKSVAYLNESKGYIGDGFQWSSSRGVLCEEPLRGVRFNIEDALFHQDNVHRGGNNVTPAARRSLYAAMLTAQPAIMEPIYAVEIQVPDNYVGTVYSSLNHKKGRVISEEKSIGKLNIIKGYLPVRQSFGFNAYIREKTSGQGFPQLTFSHWEVVPGNPLDPTTEVGKLVKEVRKRKGLKEEIPPLSDYLDRL